MEYRIKPGTVALRIRELAVKRIKKNLSSSTSGTPWIRLLDQRDLSIFYVGQGVEHLLYN